MVSGIQGFQAMGQMRPMGGMQGPRQLSSDDKQKVQDLLSQYDPTSITADDAKELFKSFEEAGIKGPGLREAISEAGFDADQVWSLAHDGQKPPQPPQGSGMGGGKDSINTTALQSLQNILSQYDLSSLSSDDETNLFTQLSNAGFMKSGSILDLNA
jgi:hypothetical protein